MSGIIDVDQPKAMYLVEIMDLSKQLMPRGAFVAKVFHGEVLRLGCMMLGIRLTY